MSMSKQLNRNSLYSLFGNGLPMVLGVITTPRLFHTLGRERFGVLTLTWAVMGYFSLFDLGLGRALTQVVAERTGMGEDSELADIIRTGLVMMLMLGLLGGLCLGIASPLVIVRMLKLNGGLHREVLFAFGWMALSVPAVTLLAGLRGILEARQRFAELGTLRLCMGTLTFLGPWLVSFRTTHLFWVVFSLELMRYGALGAHYLVCRKVVPEFRQGGTFHQRHWRKLLKFGGWMTVSNIISPIMVNMDRFFIGAFISVGAIAYYSTCFDSITKVFIISGALVTVLFPMFGSLYRADPAEANRLYRKGLKMIFLAMGPLLAAIAVAAPWLLSLWLGPEFSRQGTGVLRVLCLGVLINALAAVPFAFVQGAARPDVTAKLHLAEAPLYLGVLWGLGARFGIIGVAWAWTLRVTLDFILLLIAVWRFQTRSLAGRPGQPLDGLSNIPG